MALNIGNSSADFTPFVKYNAKAGRWYTKTDAGDEVEVTDMTAVFDFANIKTGWFHFATGLAPEVTYDTNLGQPAERPSPNHKRGFAIDVFAAKGLGGVRELMSTAGAICDEITVLYGQWEHAPEAKAGKVAVVKCESVVPVTSKHGTNYKPVLKIIKWVDRPTELNASANTVSQNNAPAPQPAPAATDDAEF
jgi:hypothetical protein